ncbi:PspC domain-containing protein [Paenibacillus sp. LMG 31456]|uniref:PspC domain-containing protein n=1 Tax=Paenibacillus foliorum TaxID=2654974 RepID=A0A972GTT2_9BACL|nr:PspC domain-containing protein [Paenibacillus foliorum]NOU93707.1 PspC domain-containing protein [Paenibacillus foliorum]
MNKLQRSTSNRRLTGLCGGLAEFLGISPTLVRLMMIIAGLCSFGTTVFVYFIASLFIPKQSYVQSYHSI